MGMPFYARLWWDGRHGHATCSGVDVELISPPPILGAPAEIDYGEAHPDELAYPPEIRIYAHESRREMTAPEVLAVHDWLRNWSLMVRRLLK